MKIGLGLVVLLCAASACGGGDSSGSVLTAPGTLVTDSFTGTLAVGAKRFPHLFCIDRRQRD